MIPLLITIKKQKINQYQNNIFCIGVNNDDYGNNNNIDNNTKIITIANNIYYI